MVAKQRCSIVLALLLDPNGKRYVLGVCSSYACVHIVAPPRSRPGPYYMYVRKEREKTQVFYKIQWKKVLKDRDHPFETQIPLLPPIPILHCFLLLYPASFGYESG